MSCGLRLPVLGSSSISTVVGGGVYRSPWKLYCCLRAPSFPASDTLGVAGPSVTPALG